MVIMLRMWILSIQVILTVRLTIMNVITTISMMTRITVITTRAVRTMIIWILIIRRTSQIKLMI